MTNLPAVKWFSSSDQSQGGPFPIECVRVDKPVFGGSYSEWAAWYKLLKLVQAWPF